MYLTRLDLRIGWLLFCERVDSLRNYIKELREYWEKLFHLNEEQLMAPGYTPGYTK